MMPKMVIPVRRRLLTGFFSVCFVLGVVGLGYAAREGRAAHTQVSFLLEKDTGVAGQNLWVGLRFKPDADWHVYWRNPGDSGLQPSLTWRLPQGVEAGDILWPYPALIAVQGLTSYGYDHEVTLLVPLKTGKDLSGVHPIGVDVDFLACKVECVPGTVHLEQEFNFSNAEDEEKRLSDVFRQARERIPVTAYELKARAAIDGRNIHIRLADRTWQGARFFPFANNLIDHNAPQVWTGLDLRVAMSALMAETPEAVRGILVRQYSKDLPQAIEINLPVVSTIEADKGDISLVWILLLAFVGGIILNLMPCVLPVLALKILALTRHGQERKQRLVNALLYTAGVLFSFFILAGVLLILRAFGVGVGWGFQFQSAGFVLMMVGLLTFFAANLWGWIEFSLPSFGSLDVAERWGAFGTGILATLLSTPCTAPFMGTALGFALTQPPVVALAIFLMLGFGLAFPYLMLSLFPSALVFLPKPGPWMLVMKAILGGALLLTAGWLIWVLDAQYSRCVVMAALLGMTGILFGLRLFAVARKYARPRLRWLAGMVLGVTVLGSVGLIIWQPKRALSVMEEGVWRAYSSEAVNRALDEGQTVFLDFTARWCLTCQVNDRTVFQEPRVKQLLSLKGVSAFKADWTRFNPEITKALEGFGQSSVPLYVILRQGREPQILPVIITYDVIAEGLGVDRVVGKVK